MAENNQPAPASAGAQEEIMKAHKWLVLISATPFPHETCRDAHEKRAGEVQGPHYSAGARWYTPGWGKGAARNREHLNLIAKTWNDRGYDLRVTEELR